MHGWLVMEEARHNGIRMHFKGRDLIFICKAVYNEYAKHVLGYCYMSSTEFYSLSRDRHGSLLIASKEGAAVESHVGCGLI